MPANQRGSALISALFIMTLVAIAATAMSTRLQLDIYRTRTLLNSDKNYLASQMVTFWAMNALSQKKIHYSRNKDIGKLLNFPSTLQQRYPGVLVKGSLYDLQAFFNINNLLDIKFHPMFLKFLENSLGNGHTDEQKKLFQSINNWITPYRAERGRDDFLNYYLTKTQGFLPGFQPLQSLSELRLIRGFNLKTYQTLLPSLTVLPEVTPINILTAPKLILMSLGNGLDASQVNEIIEAGKDKGFDTPEKSQVLLQKLDINASIVTTESQYFLTIAEASSGDLSLTAYTVLKRSRDRSGQITVELIRESLNSM